MSHTIRSLSLELLAAFTTDNPRNVVALANGRPEWMVDVVRAAHADMMPDDIRYSMIREVLSCLVDQISDDDEIDDIRDGDVIHDVCDGLVDVYTSALTTWMASHVERPGYCDEAARDFGPSDDMCASMQRGQYAEYREICDLLLQALENERDARDSDDNESEA